MSEGIQLDAVEMVRRSERALGVAIREGQAAGEIAQSTRITGGGPGRRNPDGISSPTDYLGTAGQVTHEIYQMTDNVTDEEFEMGLSIAKEEGNVTRRNMSTGARAMCTTLVLEADGRRDGGRWKRGSVNVGNTESRNTWQDAIRQCGIVLDFAPDLAAQVVNGTLALDAAFKEAELYRR